MKNTIYLWLVTLAVVLVGCKNDETMVLQNFNVLSPLTVSDTLPNFKTSLPKFSAKFDNVASWKVTITGNISKATKTFSGTSQTINVVWNGLSDNLPLFGKEGCTVELSFPDSKNNPNQIKLTTKDIVNIDKGSVLITAFATDNFNPITGWQSDWQATFTKNAKPTSADGTPYLYMTGHGFWQGTTDAEKANNPYIDYLLFKPSNSDINYGLYWPLPNNSSRVYFNAMIYCSKADIGQHYKDASITFTLGQEDGNEGSFTVNPTWEGWKIVSVNYNSLVFKKSDLPRPDRIKTLTIVTISKATAVPIVETMTAFDHLIFTLDRPFNPFNN